ncbi:1,4-dihydroxy-2-naphthoate octaprenyltransferase [Bifidobacterium dolichotidis]|uniref:1,4-dihydroxy-2-naphthoate octaprenyltransferase n=1 Tax=Bifidobacterium dolichotidis TaxID=2306976 RepID=A0A430FQ19_9BIFI|nr:1,4-dihydroxy-2-naphthoate octaprenyltransferase [Bifidobacterium dolichotidis]RSX54921.1 1,4-dihydroxy-2-naphthoate octaprenyltransferase [Bifidobacterium dolichotidis]
MTLTDFIQGARLRTLPLSVAAVVTGTAAATNWICTQVMFSGMSLREFSSWREFICPLLLCLGVAVFLQIAANFMNDYSDGIRGTDDHRDANAPRRLVAQGVAPRQVLHAAQGMVVLACICGIITVILTGRWPLLILGAVSIVAAWFYVGGSHPYGYHGMGEISAFLFFGPVAVLGTQYAICGNLTSLGLLGSLEMGLLSMAVLSINNLRDVKNDAQCGKRTWMVRLGPQRGTVLFCTLLIIFVALLVVLWIGAARSFNGVSGELLCAIIACIGTICAVLFAANVAHQVANERYGVAMAICSSLSLVFAATYALLAIVLV